MTQAELRQIFYSRLTQNYYQGELQALYHWCAQEIQHWSRVEAYLHNIEEVSDESLSRWKDVIDRLAEDEPVQYVFGTTIFFGLKLQCDSRALIPRPETEELVHIILDREPSDKMTVADIGTGSGCIALALKCHRPNWKILGLDVSSDALALAKENAKEQKLDVSFNQVNIQDEVDLSGIDVLVSNPPYIPMELQSTLDKRVIQYEPSVALFSPESKPFYFFRRIVELAKEHNVGRIYFETHATDMNLLVETLKSIWLGKIEVITDLSSKPRFLRLENV